jgi:hypothetical protein
MIEFKTLLTIKAIHADWQERVSPGTFEGTFKFQFKGPGFYMTDTDTVLVIPDTEDKPEADKYWHIEQPEGTTYLALVYNYPYQETLFSILATAPVRADTRGTDRLLDKLRRVRDMANELKDGNTVVFELDSIMDDIQSPTLQELRK